MDIELSPNYRMNLQHPQHEKFTALTGGLAQLPQEPQPSAVCLLPAQKRDFSAKESSAGACFHSVTLNKHVKQLGNGFWWSCGAFELILEEKRGGGRSYISLPWKSMQI